MIRIIVVDDQSFTRKVIKAILETESNFLLVGEAEDGIKALELISQTSVDVAVIDLNMPEMNGFELTQKICRDFPQIKVIILSGNEDKFSINQAVKSGARGYLLKNSFTENEIINTIDNVQRGYFQLGPGVLESLISDLISSEVEALEKLSKIENNYSQDFARLKDEMLLGGKETKYQLFQELHLEIDNFKSDCQKGLNNFQYQVSKQINNGLQDFTNQQHQEQLISEVWQKRYVELTQNINLLESKYFLFAHNFKKEIVILRYCIIFLLIGFILVLIYSFFVFS